MKNSNFLSSLLPRTRRQYFKQSLSILCYATTFLFFQVLAFGQQSAPTPPPIVIMRQGHACRSDLNVAYSQVCEKQAETSSGFQVKAASDGDSRISTVKVTGSNDNLQAEMLSKINYSKVTGWNFLRQANAALYISIYLLDTPENTYSISVNGNSAKAASVGGTLPRNTTGANAQVTNVVSFSKTGTVGEFDGKSTTLDGVKYKLVYSGEFATEVGGHIGTDPGEKDLYAKAQLSLNVYATVVCKGTGPQEVDISDLITDGGCSMSTYGRRGEIVSDAGEKIWVECVPGSPLGNLPTYVMYYSAPGVEKIPIGECVYICGFNTVKLFHSGDNNCNKTPDYFIRTSWRSRNYGPTNLVKSTLDHTVFVTDFILKYSAAWIESYEFNYPHSPVCPEDPKAKKWEGPQVGGFKSLTAIPLKIMEKQQVFMGNAIDVPAQLSACGVIEKIGIKIGPKLEEFFDKLRPLPETPSITGMMGKLTTKDWKPCDLNLDNICDQQDSLIFDKALGKSLFTPGYVSTADIDLDGCITETDRAIGNIPVLGSTVSLDNDKKADYTIVREGTWFAKTSSDKWGIAQGSPLLHPDGSQFFGRTFGLSQDHSVVGDFDGDGTLDIAVTRISKGEFYILPSSGKLLNWPDATNVKDSPYYVIKTAIGAVPVCGYYDTDSQMDIGYYTPNDGTWHIRTSTGKYSGVYTGISKIAEQTIYEIQFGLATDVPVSGGDFSGDIIDDLAVYRPSTGEIFILPSNNTVSLPAQRQYEKQPGKYFYSYQIGTSLIPVVSDVDGDRITDLVFWRASTGEWIIRPSSGKLPVKSTPGLTDDGSRAFIVQLGLAGDLPIGGMDLNGDGTDEIVVWRPTNGSYYAVNSGDSFHGMTLAGTAPDGNPYSVRQFGLAGDIPVTIASAAMKSYIPRDDNSWALDALNSKKLSAYWLIQYGLLSPAEISGNCSKLTKDEINKIRTHHLGSPSFCK